MKKVSIRKRFEERLREIALAEGVEVSEIRTVFRSQFKFTKENIEAINKEWLAKSAVAEINKLVYNYIYIGKVHSGQRMQEYGNNRNKFKEESNENN